jgi:hypothetical protein
VPAIAAMINFYRAHGALLQVGVLICFVIESGGEADLFHDRVMRLGESPVGAGRARDCRNDQLLSRAWRAPTGGDFGLVRKFGRRSRTARLELRTTQLLSR